ncbi:MAG: hypothetical protein J6T31_00820 [Methanobrevibacter sp.]|nr:hypothetical protein [Methanobrevibacter sp.]
MEKKKICGRCRFCEKDDGSPYCCLKELFTTVELDHECDERDFYGNLMFTPERKQKDRV